MGSMCLTKTDIPPKNSAKTKMPTQRFFASSYGVSDMECSSLSPLI